MLMTMDPDIQKNLEHLGAYDMLKELKTLYVQQADQELLQTVRDFHACKQEEGQSVRSYVLKMKSYIDNLERLGHAMTQNLSVSLILLHEQTLPPKEVAPALHAIRAGRIQKNQKKNSHKAAKGNQGKGKERMGNVLVPAPFYAPKPKNPPTPKKDNHAKDAICHQCGEVGHWRRNCPIYIVELMKKKKLSQGASTSGIFTIELYSFPITSWVCDTGCGTHICITTQGFMESKKLKPRALSLYVGDGHRATVEAIGEFHLCLPSGLVLILHNCHYAPSITRGIISVSRLYKDDFVNRFENDNSISVSKNNLIYFNDIPRDDIYEIVMSSLNTNESSMFACVACMSGKMARKPYSHQVERAKDLLGLIHTDSFLNYALESVARILNMVPTKKFDKISYEVWHGQAPKLSYLKLWGCETLVKHDTLIKPDKLEPRAFKCIFVGYPKETMRYSFYYPPENKVFIAQNAEFFENDVIDHEASGSLEDLEIIQEENTHTSLDTSLNHEEDDQEIDEPQSDINPIRRSTRTHHPTDRLCLYVDAEEHELGDLGEPANYKAALLDPEFDKWLNAINVEMQSMKDNEVWELVDLPPDGKTVGHKWLFKKKTDMDGAVHTYKARLVAKGFTQTPGIDYEETFSPVADIRAIRILIAIAAFYDYEIWQMDVKTAFLNGYLNEEVYMEQPEGFVSQKFPNRVCKLKRSIYGLKQASRQWNKRFDDEIKKFRFSQNRDEPCVYVKASGSYVTFLILYVDDILIMGNNIPMLQDVKSYLGRCFAMKDLGEAAYILGIKIYRDRSKRLISLCQSAYIKKILKIYYMENSKRRMISMQENLKFSKSQGASTPAEIRRMQNIPYASGVQNRAIAIEKDHRVTKGARHFHAKVHYLRETIEMGDVKIEKVDMDDNLAGHFIKALAFPKHSELIKKIGMIPASSLM
ncbi:retrotransposon protein, putative, ty1-copia subclass [Tanacetum coccineum]